MILTLILNAQMMVSSFINADSGMRKVLSIKLQQYKHSIQYKMYVRLEHVHL